MIQGLHEEGVEFYFKDKNKIRLQNGEETHRTVSSMLMDSIRLYSLAKNKGKDDKLAGYKKMETERIIEQDVHFVPNIIRIAKEMYMKLDYDAILVSGVKNEYMKLDYDAILVSGVKNESSGADTIINQESGK